MDYEHDRRRAVGGSRLSDPVGAQHMIDPSKQGGLDGDESDADAPTSLDDGERLANGPIYLLANLLMRAAQKISLVEALKLVACTAMRAKTREQKRRVSSFAIDLFLAAKWAFVAIVWTCGIANWLVVVLVVYLLIWNSLTYFYYHLWIVELPNERVASAHRDRRRFVSLVFAMAFSMVTYAYLYQRVLPDSFEWPDPVPRSVSAIAFSIGNALTSQAGGLKPVTSASYLLSASQLVFTFGFVAMLLSSSVPRVRPS